MAVYGLVVLLPAGLQKTTVRISTIFRWRMGLGPEQTPLTFGADTKLTEFEALIISCDGKLNIYGFWMEKNWHISETFHFAVLNRPFTSLNL